MVVTISRLIYTFIYISYCKKIEEETLISVINNNPRLTHLDILGTYVTNTFFTNISSVRGPNYSY